MSKKKKKKRTGRTKENRLLQFKVVTVLGCPNNRSPNNEQRIRMAAIVSTTGRQAASIVLNPVQNYYLVKDDMQ
jgi:hypothetical protein